MVPQAHRDHLTSVCDADIEGARLHVRCAENMLLEFDDALERRDQRAEHFLGGILSFPSSRASTKGAGQVGHVHGREVFRVSCPMDILVRGFLHQVEHVSADVGEMADDPVVHDRVSAEDEGVVVDGGHGRGCCGADVCKDCRRRSARADAVEVGVIVGRLAVLVDCWARAGGGGDE